MTHAPPERIWAKTHSGKRTSGFWQNEPILPNKPENIGTEYVRAVLAAAAHAAGYREGLEAAAQEAYRVCAETRHVTLGVKIEAAIRALMEDTP